MAAVRCAALSITCGREGSVVASPPRMAGPICYLSCLAVTVIIPPLHFIRAMIVFPSISILISFVIHPVARTHRIFSDPAMPLASPTFWVAFHFLPEGLGAPHSFNSFRDGPFHRRAMDSPLTSGMLPSTAFRAGRLIQPSSVPVSDHAVKNGELSGGGSGAGHCWPALASTFVAACSDYGGRD